MAAKGHLAVRADCFYVAGGHLAEGLGWVGVLGGHDGQAGVTTMIYGKLYAALRMLSNERMLLSCECACPSTRLSD